MDVQRGGRAEGGSPPRRSGGQQPGGGGASAPGPLWRRLCTLSLVSLVHTPGTSSALLALELTDTRTSTVLAPHDALPIYGTGTYRLEMDMTPGPYAFSAGDQGGALTNGSVHTGALVQ